MSVTKWERQRAIANRLHGVWDAHRDGRAWKDVYAEAHEKVTANMEAELEMARAMDWEAFKAVMGWPATKEPQQ